MQRLFLLIIVVSLCLLPTIAQDEASEFPDIIGKTLPQAAALLNTSNYRLAPMMLSTNSGEGVLNTIIDFEILENNVVQVTVLREYNVRLIWENSDAFANQAGLRDLNGDELFTFVNLSDEQLSLANIQIADFETSVWGTFLRPNQCAQAWSYSNTSFVTLDDCEAVQGGSITSITQTNQQFWLTEESFDIYQNGVYRATCQQSQGTCDLWLSPSAIAEDIAPYIYLIYDDNQLLVFNNSDNQWMDVSQVSINNSRILSETRNWDWIRFEAFERLAPNQCLRFTTTLNDEIFDDCDQIAYQVTEDAFWTESFTVQDNLNGTSTYQCPPSAGNRTICLFGR